MKAFESKISLYDEKLASGSSGSRVKSNQKTAKCHVSEAGSMVTLTALAAGTKLSCTAVMWKSEYAHQRYAEIDGTKYTIISSAAEKNPLAVKLLLERG